MNKTYHVITDSITKKSALKSSDGTVSTGYIFDSASGFIGDRCVVKIGTCYSLIDKNLKYLTKFVFNEIQPRVGQYYSVKVGNKYGVIDLNGNLIVDILYDKVYINAYHIYAYDNLNMAPTVINIDHIITKSLDSTDNIQLRLDLRVLFDPNILYPIESNPFNESGYEIRVGFNGKYGLYNKKTKIVLTKYLYSQIDRISSEIYLLWFENYFHLYDTKNGELYNQTYINLVSPYENIYILENFSNKKQVLSTKINYISEKYDIVTYSKEAFKLRNLNSDNFTSLPINTKKRPIMVLSKNFIKKNMVTLPIVSPSPKTKALSKIEQLPIVDNILC